MAWLFSLSLECGAEREPADTLARYLGDTELTSGGQTHDATTAVQQDEEDHWWACVYPRGISPSAQEPGDGQLVADFGAQLCARLRTAPPLYRYAFVGIEVDVAITFAYLAHLFTQPDTPLDGLILQRELWQRFGSQPGFEPFSPGYLWRP